MPPTPPDATADSDGTDTPTADDVSTDDVSTDDAGGGWSLSRRPSRRRVLRTLVNGAYAAGVAGVIEGTGALGGDDGRVSVTYALAHDDPGDPTSLVARTTSVPAQWHDLLARSFELREEIVGWDLSGVRDVFVVPGSFEHPTPSFSTSVTDGSARDRLLERFDGVGVDLDVSILDDAPSSEPPESTPTEPVALADVRRRSVPGGVICNTGGGTRGSLAPGMYDSETGSRWFATANHLYGAGGTKETEHAGEPLYVRGEDDSRKVGEVVRGYPDQDVVRIEPVEDASPASAVYGEATVVGQFTRAGLALLKARGDSLEKVGAFSGHTRGSIEGIDGITCYAGEICKSGQLKWGDESVLTDGDSGSVNYHADPENPDRYLLVGGFNSARTWWPGADFAWGTAAYHLTDTLGLHF